MAQDFARAKGSQRKKPAARRKAAAERGAGGNGLRWYLAGVLSGVFASFLFYLGTLPGPAAPPQATPAEDATGDAIPKPRFDFYTILPEQRIEDEVEVQQPRAAAQANAGGEYYLLQAGSFRQQEDADRRRAELLLLGLEPTIRESTGDNGRWFRVYLGPFQTRAAMSRARSLTAGQNIDTLVLKRSG